MTPAQFNLLRATALLSQVPASGVLRDGVREALAVVDAETARGLNAPRAQCTDTLPIAEANARKILDRAAFGLRKYGVSLDDAGLDPAAWLLHLQEELLDGANYVESFRRALMANAAPTEPPHAAAPVLAPLAPEPPASVLGRAGEALGASPLPYSVMQPGWTPPPGVLKTPSGEAMAWDGQQPPVHVPFEPGAPHPYGDDAYQMTTDGVARMFPSKEAAHRWLVAMGKAL